MKSPRWIVLVGMTAMFVPFVSVYSRVQEPAPPAAPAAPAPQTPAPAKPQKQTYSHANDFLITGTVFDPKGYAFPGVELRIRRNTEKKFRWDGYTNSRGEFAVRVPKGSDYEMIIHAKGFADQTRALDAKTGLSEARIVFRMESGGGEKK
ncbi:MAG: carboxypeptidase-like regulatory domain-containing protein [Candidatus Acidiferrum sp.]